jgi:predicted phosphodiesterase
MRWALLADIHGNLEALRAVLRDLEDWPDHRVLCTGDIVGYGPDPEACLELLGERDATCVAGNHEEMVLGRLGFDRCVHAGIRAAVWTRSNLSGWALERIAALPRVARPVPELVVCHAVPDDPERYVTSAEIAEPILEGVAREFPGAVLVVSGHTHFASFHQHRGNFRFARPGTSEEVIDDRLQWVNPGAVGQARDGKLLARYARYDSSIGAVTYCAVAYDPAPTLAKLRRLGLVASVCYSLPQQSWIQRKLNAARSRWARARQRRLSRL